MPPPASIATFAATIALVRNVEHQSILKFKHTYSGIGHDMTSQNKLDKYQTLGQKHTSVHAFFFFVFTVLI